VESFDGSIWEPACGEGAIAKVLSAASEACAFHNRIVHFFQLSKLSIIQTAVVRIIFNDSNKLLASIVDFFHITAYFHLVCVKLSHISRMIRIWALTDFRRQSLGFRVIYGDFGGNFRHLGSQLSTVAATEAPRGAVRRDYRGNRRQYPRRVSVHMPLGQ
jgi:hypothetical protein